MAKIVIQGLPEATNANLPYTYADLHLDLREKYLINNPLNQRPEINDIMVDYDVDALKNSLLNLFSTSPGDKILSPEFGLDLRQYIFEPITRERAFDLQRTIYSGITRFEPRIVVKQVVVVPDFDNMEYNISIYYAVPTLNITNARLAGSLNKNGYNYI
jgi:phage baseplate assembly protein W